MTQQLTLADNMRVEPPACYADVAETIEIALENEPELAEWSADRLAHDMLNHANWPDEPPSLEIVAKCIRIYRERQEKVLL